MRDAEWRRLLEKAGFRVEGIERHFVPVRFFPAWPPVPDAAHRFLDRAFGTLAYFRLRKPASRA